MCTACSLSASRSICWGGGMQAWLACVLGGMCAWGMHAWGHVCLEGMHSRGCACPGGVYARGMCAMHAPPMNRRTDTCENITLPQTSFAGGNKSVIWMSANIKKGVVIKPKSLSDYVVTRTIFVLASITIFILKSLALGFFWVRVRSPKSYAKGFRKRIVALQ